MNPRWQRYKALELISEQTSEQISEPSPIAPAAPESAVCQNLLLLLGGKVWQAIEMALLRDLQPRVWQSRDHQTGRISWNLYDPQTGKTRRLDSDSDVRDWLEQLIYR